MPKKKKYKKASFPSDLVLEDDSFTRFGHLFGSFAQILSTLVLVPTRIIDGNSSLVNGSSSQVVASGGRLLPSALQVANQFVALKADFDLLPGS